MKRAAAKAKEAVEPDVPNEFKVSQSKVKVYRRCKYAYHLRYVEKLRKKVKSRPLQFGTIVHSLLEADAEGDDPFDVLKKIEKENVKLFKAEREMYGEIISDVRQIMTEYFDYWPEKDLRFERYNKRSGEHEFNIDMGVFDQGLSGVVWNGKIDAIGRTPNKLRWIVEHKTFSRRPNDDERWRNLQSASYITVVQVLGWGEVDGMCWDYIRSKSPVRPGILQNGQLSQKNIDTLPITVRETCKELELNPKEYGGFIKRVADSRSDWFQRIHTPVNQEVVTSVMGDFLDDTRRMVEDHGKNKSKNIDRHCSWCDFEGICRAELQGLDADYVRQKDFTVSKEKRDEKENSLTDSAD